MGEASVSNATRPVAGVAMCVFNGARYLPEQLASIAAQTELPRRMVVVDDGSTDGSWELLEQWAAAAPFTVTLHRNEGNLGVVRNFEKAARLLLDEVDVVFFSDQDDRWYPGKLARCVDAFAADPRVSLVHSDADLVDSDGMPLGSRLFKALLVTRREREDVAAGHAYRSYVRRNLVTGAACACRSGTLAQALPFSGHMVHDEWISFAASLVGRVVMLEEPLMAYRLHGANTVGLPIPTPLWWCRNVLKALVEPQAENQARRLARVEAMKSLALRLAPSGEVMSYLERAIAHARHRSTLSRNPLRRARAVYVVWRQGEYNRWSSGGISMLHDLLIAT